MSISSEIGNQDSNTQTVHRPLILLVEDDDVFRHLIAENLEAAGYDTRHAENGIVAKTIFDLNVDRIAIIISDIRMPKVDGLEFLKHVRKTADTPFIMMTGFSEVLETKQAHHHGATDFILKPFKKNVLLDAIKNCLNPTANLPADPEPDNKYELPKYCAIHIDEFISSSKLQSDIFIKLSGDKYVKIAHEGDLIPVNRLRTYRDKHVEFLYVLVDDFDKYVNFNQKISKAALQMPASSISSEKKLFLMRVTTETILHKCFLTNIDPGSVKAVQNTIEQTLNITTQDAEILDVFFHLHTRGDRIYSNSVASAVLACLVAKRHGWHAASTLFRLTLAGLFQDIGFKELDPSLVRKKRISRTAEETKLIESHPIRSRDIVLRLKGIPEEVAQIVYQHQETLSGTGYPQRPKVDDIHALARLLITVNTFVELISPLEDQTESLTPEAALYEIRRSHREDVDMTFVRRLMELFGVTSDTSLGST
jgi:response regulator RpfG family c-di-GMP phosphodiesterase